MHSRGRLSAFGLVARETENEELFGIREKQFRNYVERAVKKTETHQPRWLWSLKCA